eukprot:TRINITY_DN3570_c0_g1_i14.p1 TRINITY_DN3570_c0_g1~~TRINITY_DN3570_c0_g1_i14.p1  ORF type:complete len:523 (+),score=139.21 TRINITY_DN3570_c0_g1_i14:238-1806(+)
MDPAQIQQTENRQKMLEEEREKQARIDAIMRQKMSQNAHSDELSIDRWCHDNPRRSPQTTSPRSNEHHDLHEEEREKMRLLRSVSGRGLFSGAGHVFQKKSLQELEEDRKAWRDREETKRQKDAEERRRKQEAIQKRDEEERQNKKNQEVVTKVPQIEMDNKTKETPGASGERVATEAGTGTTDVGVDGGCSLVEAVVGTRKEEITEAPTPEEVKEKSDGVTFESDREKAVEGTEQHQGNQVILEELLRQLTLKSQVQENSEARELMIKLGQLRDLLPYYKDEPSVHDVGHFLANFSRVIVFLRGAVYLYPHRLTNLAVEFEYTHFMDSISGYVKFLLENLNFLTFEDDRNRIIKASDALLQIAVVFINEVCNTFNNNTSGLKIHQEKWEKLCSFIFEHALSSTSEKASVEEQREQVKRALTNSTLLIQRISHELHETMFPGVEFKPDIFSNLLHQLTATLQSVHKYLNADGVNELLNIAKGVLQTAMQVIQTKANDPAKRIALEKYLVVALLALLRFRDAI